MGVAKKNIDKQIFSHGAHHEGIHYILHFKGPINEQTPFVEIKIPDDVRSLVLELDGVDHINSVGLRDWVQWFRSLNKGLQITVRNCQRVVIDQINILQGLFPRSTQVESFYVPYYCEACGHEDQYLAQRNRDFFIATADTKEGVTIPATRKCSQCQAEAEIDVVPERYFRFLRYRP